MCFNSYMKIAIFLFTVDMEDCVRACLGEEQMPTRGVDTAWVSDAEN